MRPSRHTLPSRSATGSHDRESHATRTQLRRRRWLFERLEERLTLGSTLELLIGAALLSDASLTGSLFADDRLGGHSTEDAKGLFLEWLDRKIEVAPPVLAPLSTGVADTVEDQRAIPDKRTPEIDAVFDEWLSEKGHLGTVLGLLIDALQTDESSPNLNQSAIGEGEASGGSAGEVGPDLMANAGDALPSYLPVMDGPLTDEMFAASMSMPPPNPPPVANNDTYGTPHDRILSAPSPGVLVNDADPMPGPSALTASVVSTTTHGSLTLNSNGSFVYVPQPLYVGSDAFTYRVFDGATYSSPATVTINVTNAAPVAFADFYETSWREVPADTESLVVPAQGVKWNDADPDTDPIVSILAAGPSNGTLTSIPNPGTLGQDGSFIYTPSVGYSGEDSFTYYVTDQIAQSQPAEVKVKVFKIDIDIYDGVEGNLVPALKELSRGVYTVANKNDTNGDGIPDLSHRFVESYSTGITFIAPNKSYITVQDVTNFRAGETVFLVPTGSEDSERLVIKQIFETTRDVTFVDEGLVMPKILELDYPNLGDMFHGGQDEKDLMKLSISAPNPIDPNVGMVTLILSPGMTLWDDSLKETEIPHVLDQTVRADIPVDTLPREIWIEATQVSASLRDFQIEARYRTGNDRIKATAIWSELAVETATMDAAELFGTAPNFTHWNDMELPPRDWIDGPRTNAQGGTGLRPITAERGVQNAMVAEWTVTPVRNQAIDGTWESDGVIFDATRQVEARHFIKFPNDPDWHQVGPPDREWFPQNVYYGNDDGDGAPGGSNGDESATTTTPNNRFYQLDGPGISTGIAVATVADVVFQNFNSWLQVRFDGVEPDWNGSGSRASDILRWHSRHYVVASNGPNSPWVRTGTNEVASGHMDVRNSTPGE